MPNLIADMNAQALTFTVHDGDLKQGSDSPCDDNLYYQSLGYFNALRAPAMFTPGDNDWTDCDRPANGGFNSLRAPRPRAAGLLQHAVLDGPGRLRQEVQTDSLCLGVNGTVPCVENRRWTIRGVTYVTLNVPGSCNNLCDTAPTRPSSRRAMPRTSRGCRRRSPQAKARGSAAVMLITQANPGWDMCDPTRAPLRNPQTLAADRWPARRLQGLPARAARRGRRSSASRWPTCTATRTTIRVDKPFLDAAGRRLENFTRVETFGNNAGERQQRRAVDEGEAWTRAAARCSPTSRRSCRATARQYRRRSAVDDKSRGPLHRRPPRREKKDVTGPRQPVSRCASGSQATFLRHNPSTLSIADRSGIFLGEPWVQTAP